ncbi:tRNA-uridine aminocarboxypropyltransferase [Aeromonas sp. XH]|uniref:tRNA-uridine aminocarboxypropyltransferase n=1 Tax=Aeromonas sp. XH TaxID=3081770 RepID=UPI0029676958|nr:tRNA-uridine aminocarboxypropyltransferase [Aeromonas sp. XH]WOX46809.1 tRNA-uridine aminocarboxypropyltransferase [Aeromonas sp. XH]
MTQSRPDFSDNMKQPNDKESRYCTRCTRALKACLCEYVRQVPHHAPLHILQHPTEVGHPKGTAALLAASLGHARIHVGEDFEGDEGLNALLADPDAQCYLLWPDDEALTPLQARAHLARRAGQGKASAHFILLDGTWRKAYRMLHRNPALLGLPRITLGTIAGQYSIRKSPFPGALSTLEAGYHLLSQWEGDAERFAPLMELFTHLNRQWHEFADGRRR